MKNVKSLVLNCALVVLAALTLGFLAGAYVEVVSGYDLLELISYTNYLASEEALIVVSTLFIVMFGALLLALGLVGMLFDFEVIKCEKAAKIIRIVEMVLACLLFAFALIALVTVAALGAAVGWGLILNFIVAAGLVAVPVTALVLTRKK